MRSARHQTAWSWLAVPVAALVAGLLIGWTVRPVGVILDRPPVRAELPAGVPRLEELVAVPTETPTLTLVGTFTAYAYCPCQRCCGQWSGGPTASGTMPEEGRTVAADWDVLPAGTEIYIEDIGWRTVEDTGSGIVGQALDVYMTSHQSAIAFGTQTVNVYTVAR